MKIDPPQILALLTELIDENPLACRAVLSICSVEFTEAVETLCVSLGRPSRLLINPVFVAKHCRTEKHVKAVLVHEFLHVLLRHTIRFKKNSPALNVALDAVINSIIHRVLGAEYSSLFTRYYADAQGMLRLLRPCAEPDPTPSQLFYLGPAEAREREFWNLHQAVYLGELVSDDLIEICRHLRSHEIEQALAKAGVVLIGNHSGGDGDPLDELEPDVAARVRSSLGALNGTGIFRDPERTAPSALQTEKRQSPIPAYWRRQTLAILRRMLEPDPKGTLKEQTPLSLVLPVLNNADRRGWLRAVWNPILPDIRWQSYKSRPLGSVQVYLDVSGSMGLELDALVRLLSEFRQHIRMPFWAFSTSVCPAVICHGKLVTQGTGGTSVTAVFEHIARTRPQKALLITDGYVEKPSAASLRSVQFCKIEGLVSATGTPDVLRGAGITLTQLAAFKES